MHNHSCVQTQSPAVESAWAEVSSGKQRPTLVCWAAASWLLWWISIKILASPTARYADCKRDKTEDHVTAPNDLRWHKGTDKWGQKATQTEQRRGEICLTVNWIQIWIREDSGNHQKYSILMTVNTKNPKKEITRTSYNHNHLIIDVTFCVIRNREIDILNSYKIYSFRFTS